MAKKLGREAKLYRQTTGTREAWPASGAAPNLDEVTNIRDVTLSLTKDEVDASTRGGNGWKEIMTALKDAEISFQMLWNTGDADFTAFKDAFFNDTTIAVAVLDGSSSTAGTQGLWADFEVLNFTRNESLTDPMTVDVTIKPSGSSDVAPAWATVGS